ncbi:cytochrome P450 4C1-like isoform X2 [Sipha flava]|nr:cytochrome P450 4C1-like isoform X2 [Sipha flava]
MEVLKQNGSAVHLNLVGRSYVIINDPEDIKIVLSSSQYNYKGNEYNMMRPWLNDGLLLSSGSKWHNRRKLLSHTFHLKTLEMYNISFNKHSRILAKKISEASANNEEISITEYITLCSLDMICETIMGVEMNAQEGKSMQYVRSIKGACRAVIDRVFKFWLWNDTIYKFTGSGRSFYKSIRVLHDFTENVIKNKQTLLNNTDGQNMLSEIKPHGKKQTKSFLDLLLNVLKENPNQMTDSGIREEVDTFLFEGHDTSSLAITMAIVLLGIHQDIQDRAREEVLEIIGDSDRDVTMEDLNSMKYLEAIIKETLRLYPSVPVFTRQLETTLNIKNYIIPPKTTIVIYPYILHRTEEIYPNPEEFIPERFLNEDNKSKFLFGYLPFSAGPRNCVGQKFAMHQMKILISTILRKLKIETLGKKEDILISAQVITRIESLPKIKFYKI